MELRDRLELFKNKGWKYNLDTGEIFSHMNKLISSLDSDGYISCNLWIDNKRIRIKGHQLAWYLTYNEIPNILDHINRIKNDNKISNLRKVTSQQNNFNMNAKGCYFDKDRNSWRSLIKINRKIINLGRFKTEEEAHNNYLKAKEKYHIIK
jgi:hypothetical protein